MVIFFLIGVAIIALGIRMLVVDYKDKKRKTYKAMVIECVENYDDVRYTNRRYYDVTLEIETDYGILRKTIQTNKLYNIGYGCEVYYDIQTDSTNFAKGDRKSKVKESLFVIGFGVIWCTIIGLAMWMQTSKEAAQIGGMILAYGIAITFVCIGLYGLIVMPIKRKKSMEDCKIIPGKQVDFTVRRGKKGRKLYNPIYGFYYNGMEQTIHSSMSSNTSKYRQIGRPVNIIVNEKTGVICCAEDVSSTRKMYILFGVMGAVVLTIMVLSNFTDVSQNGDNSRENSVDYSYEYETYNDKLLDVNSEGYSTKHLEMSAAERYSEYTYLPGEENIGKKAYGYTIKVYNCGVGEVIIFPIESTGKGFNQFFSFNVNKSNINFVIDDTKQYDYNKIVGENDYETIGDGFITHEYIYYYDGKVRRGSGGYDIESYIFTSVANHIKGCVPVKVWEAINEEIDRYYE